MSQFDEKMEIYKAAVSDLGLGIGNDLLEKVAKGLGPSIYNNDSSLVASSDPEELNRVKQNFLIKKLGLKDGPELDEAIERAVKAMGSGNRSKHRAVFYAYLVKHLGKEGIYN